MNLAQFASLVGPSIATLMAIFALVVVRGTKVSEFRQKWIDDQRGDIAVVISESSKLAGTSPVSVGSMSAFDLASARIKLREKPPQTGVRWLIRKITFRSVGPEWALPIAVIDDIRGIVLGTSSNNLGDQQNELIRLARIKLKGEWERVRAGEIGYKLLLLLAALLALGPLMPLLAAMLDSFIQTGNMPSPSQMLNNSGYATGK
ncbi:hypothetical protein SAMN05192583_0084 [Sphingomonas gellani]|uniref:Uncharacterized protein n=1 Tax=Sphingomonas gellani TaxID=1166340 RepID=A0A1H7Y684_9SPHN|nr:hypothetical protein [Sphingomonas gellani]SEM40837.1 hypothetical protein SAMN05192583_0084 [Sphingomonas gellani]